MKPLLRTFLLGAVVTASLFAGGTPAAACIPDDPNCVRRVVCVPGEIANQVANKLGYSEPIPCD